MAAQPPGANEAVDAGRRRTPEDEGVATRVRRYRWIDARAEDARRPSTPGGAARDPHPPPIAPCDQWPARAVRRDRRGPVATPPSGQRPRRAEPDSKFPRDFDAVFAGEGIE